MPHRSQTICVTGTKGKSTTSALLAHMLRKLGKKTALSGNIGVPMSDADGDADYTVIEISSYQAANFDGCCDYGVLTSLYPEHIDWHRSLDAYFRDKFNLLTHAAVPIVNAEALPTIKDYGLACPGLVITNNSDGLHPRDEIIYNASAPLGRVTNPHLARHHNLINLCLALSVIQKLGLDTKAALESTADFQGLPHRQHELGTKNAILYVDDSISTTPQSAMAAIDAYHNRAITLILGGYDRGIDYDPIIKYVLERDIHAVICLGPSGARMAAGLQKTRTHNLFIVDTMPQAVATAEANTSAGGVILLSPAAPSYGLFKDFVARGEAFAAAAGFAI